MKNTKPTQPTETQHPLDHLHQLLAQLVQHYRRPEPAHTTLALALAELLQPARHTIAPLGSRLGRLTFPACAYRLFQRYFDPQRAFRRLFEPCLAALPPNEPLRVILDATQVPRTGNSASDGSARATPCPLPKDGATPNAGARRSCGRLPNTALGGRFV